jgi:hypothetical protein
LTERFHATGKIVGSPNAKAGHMFQVQWDMNSLSNGIDPTWLKIELPPTKEVKECLQRVITMYSAQGNTSLHHRAGDQSAKDSNVGGGSQNDNNAHWLQPATLIPIVRLQYLADLRTTASRLLSISNSTSHQSRESSYVGTRSSDLSDSGSGEDEDDDFELINEFKDGNLGL